MGFKEEYAKFTQPSPAREDFVYKSVTSKLTKDQILNSMKSITVDGPNGTKITYKVMPDYLSIEGMRVPMSGATAQRVANYFGLSLPSSKMTQEIYQNADVKVTAKPLSGSGAEVEGKKYTGKDVVDTGVGYAPFALTYNEKINQQLSERGAKEGQIVSGFAKDITSAIPGKEDSLGLHGFYDAQGKPIQGGTGQTPHDTKFHTEYGAFARLVSPEIEITYPDGRKETKPANAVYQISSYTAPKASKEAVEPETPAKPTNTMVASTAPKPSTTTKPSVAPKASQPASNPFGEIDTFLEQFKMAVHQRRQNIIKRALKMGFKKF